MTLEDKKTLIDWNDAKESNVKRCYVLCPNCSKMITSENAYENGFDNMSNGYECPVCNEKFLIWFYDKEKTIDDEFRITKKQWKLFFIFKIGTIIGLMFGFYIGLAF